MDKVFKKIHEDGSETVIKQVKGAFMDKNNNYKEKDDYVTSIFISSSVGCPYSCVFCHLTEMSMPFKKLSAEQIRNNVNEAVEECEFVDIDTTFKLCWMGMGDPAVNPLVTVDTSVYLSMVLDVNEIDISSIRYSRESIEAFNSLASCRPTRLFYSIHSPTSDGRERVIPKAASISGSLINLSKFKGKKFLHYTPVAELNDGISDAKGIAQWASSFNIDQVRMLNFNPYGGSKYSRPSIDRLIELRDVFVEEGVDVKWQVSKGYGELAACGMFHRGGE